MTLVNTGTVIHATYRTEDLIPAFCEVLEHLDIEAKLCRLARRAAGGLIQTESLAYNHPAREAAQRQADFAIEDLFDALNEIAPDGYYFGAHPGDGSDYGFWEIEEDYA